MCGRFNLTASGEEIAEAFDLDEVAGARAPLQHRAFPAGARWCASSPRPPTGASPSSRGASCPRGSLEGDRGFINARAETAWDKPSFREAFARRRCLIPANGFYEWQARPAARKQPWHLRPRLRAGSSPSPASGSRPIAKARRRPARSSPPSPTTLAREIHDRMPVILARADYARWLDPRRRRRGALRPLLAALPRRGDDGLPVGAAVNDPRCDDPPA